MKFSIGKLGLFSLVALSLLSQPSFGGQNYKGTIKVPCAGNGDMQGFRGDHWKCATVKNEIADLFKQRQQVRRQAFYDGVIADFTEPSESADTVPGLRFRDKVCSIGDGEKSKNHRGQNCGSYVKLKKSGLDFSNGRGKREQAWMRGAWLQALQCYSKQIEDEIRADQVKYTLRSQSQFEEMKRLYGQMTASQLNLEGHVSKGATQELGRCDLQQQLSGSGIAAGEACKFEMGRTKLKTRFAEILDQTELMARAERGYAELFGTAEGMERFRRAAENRMTSCEGWAKDRCGLIPSESCVVRKANTCYQNRMPAFMKQKIDEYFPKNGRCKVSQVQQPQPVHAGFGFGLLLSLFIVSVSLVSTGCSGRRAIGVSSSSCTFGAGNVINRDQDRERFNLCCSNQLEDSSALTYVYTPKSEDQLSESQIATCTGGIAVADSVGTNQVNMPAVDQDTRPESSEGSNEAMQTMAVEESGGTRHNPGDLATRAATASVGGVGGGHQNNNGLKKLGMGDLAGSGGGSSGGTGGSSGGGFGGSGDVSTGPAAGDAEGAGAAGAGDPNARAAKGSTYASGGGKAGGAGGRKGKGRGFAGMFGKKGAASAGEGDLNFGDDPSGGNDNPMLSEDPDDYFSFIDPNNSLFKIVETRYKKKSIAWEQHRNRNISSN